MWQNASWISRQVRRVKQEAHANSELKRRMSAFPRGKLNNCCFAFFEKVEKSGPFNQRGWLAWISRWSFVPAWASLKLVRQQPFTPCSDPTFSRTLRQVYCTPIWCILWHFLWAIVKKGCVTNLFFSSYKAVSGEGTIVGRPLHCAHYAICV